MDKDEIKKAIDTVQRAQRNYDLSKLIPNEDAVGNIIGIGFENDKVDRRLHTELLNKEVPRERRTGELEEKWKFPSFEKNIKVIINGS